MLTLNLGDAELCGGKGRQPLPVQPLRNADAYGIYNLLLPHGESYAFAEDALIVQENGCRPRNLWRMSEATGD